MPDRLKPCPPLLLSPTHPDEWLDFSHGIQIPDTLKTQPVGQTSLTRVLEHLASILATCVLNVTKLIAVRRNGTQALNGSVTYSMQGHLH